MQQPDQPVYEPEPGDLDLPATKRDLQGLATKEDLKVFVTKDALSTTLDKALQAHTLVVTDAVSRIMEEHAVAIRSDIAGFKQEALSKIAKAEEERAIVTARVKDQLADHERFLVTQGKPAYRP